MREEREAEYTAHIVHTRTVSCVIPCYFATEKLLILRKATVAWPGIKNGEWLVLVYSRHCICHWLLPVQC